MGDERLRTATCEDGYCERSSVTLIGRAATVPTASLLMFDCTIYPNYGEEYTLSEYRTAKRLPRYNI
jgi:hypothetical protein